jgi:hypothetical protein
MNRQRIFVVSSPKFPSGQTRFDIARVPELTWTGAPFLGAE